MIFPSYSSLSREDQVKFPYENPPRYANLILIFRMKKEHEILLLFHRHMAFLWGGSDG